MLQLDSPAPEGRSPPIGQLPLECARLPRSQHGSTLTCFFPAKLGLFWDHGDSNFRPKFIEIHMKKIAGSILFAA